MITVLIPLGEIPFFVNANLKNFEESCGYNLIDIDFVFLTSETISENLQAAIDKAMETFKFRVLKAPLQVDGPDCHLQLLDWAFYNADLNDIVFVQHNDVFWTPGSNWLKRAVADIEGTPNCSFFVPDDAGERFCLDGKPVLRSQGYAAAFRLQRFIGYNLSFCNGIFGEGTPLSHGLKKAIESGRVTWSKVRRSASVPPRPEVVIGIDSTDGADIIGLEAALRFPDEITTIELSDDMVHLWHFYDMYYDLSRDGDTLIVNRSSKMAEVGIHYYSWVSSFMFDKNTMKDKIFPWQVELQHGLGARDDFSDKVCQMLSNYAEPGDIVGNMTDGIKYVRFTDTTLTLE
jgi:hypothetical protein